MIGVTLSILAAITVAFCAVIVTILLTGLPPRTTFPFEQINLAPPRKLENALKPNNLVDSAERLFDGELHGIWNLLVHNGKIFATVRNGSEVVHLNGTDMHTVARIGFCDQKTHDEACDHPTGIAFSGNNLIVSDAYHGIYQVSLLNGHRKQLVSRDDDLNGSKTPRKPRLFSGVAVASTGDIYWTEASSDFDLHDGLFAVLANPSGRLVKYDSKTGRNTVLLDKLYYANGVVLGPKEEYVLVSEGMASRVRRYYLDGSKAGRSDVLVDRLPEFVSNLAADKDGIWVVLSLTEGEDVPSWARLFSRVPLIRKVLAHTLALMELPIYIVHWICPNDYFQWYLHFVGRLEMIPDGAPVAVVRLDWSGDIVATLHGAIGDTSVGSFGGDLYLASKNDQHLKRIPNLGRLQKGIAMKRYIEPAPIHEKIMDDTPVPVEDKLKVIFKDGEQGEL